MRGGRKAGSKNKITFLAHEKASELGVDPFTVLLLFAKGDWKALGYESAERVIQDGQNGTKYEMTIEPSIRMKAAADACRYLYPTQKALELTTGEDTGIKVVIEDYSAKS